MESFLYQASIYLAAAVIAVPIAARLGLGSVLGYLAAGILIGPVLGLVGTETADLQHFAEFGVVMMLFLIGLELEPAALWAMRHRLIGLGGVHDAGLPLAVITETAGLEDRRGAQLFQRGGRLLPLGRLRFAFHHPRDWGIRDRDCRGGDPKRLGDSDRTFFRFIPHS